MSRSIYDEDAMKSWAADQKLLIAFDKMWRKTALRKRNQRIDCTILAPSRIYFLFLFAMWNVMKIHACMCANSIKYCRWIRFIEYTVSIYLMFAGLSVLSLFFLSHCLLSMFLFWCHLANKHATILTLMLSPIANLKAVKILIEFADPYPTATFVVHKSINLLYTNNMFVTQNLLKVYIKLKAKIQNRNITHESISISMWWNIFHLNFNTFQPEASLENAD